MKTRESITLWLEQLREDSSSAARHLWESYFQRMVKIARQHLPREKRQVADEEDVALSAFKSFCHGVKQGRFKQLVDRKSVWPFLVGITIHKAKDQARFVCRQKRGGEAKHELQWEDILSHEPTPEFMVLLAEEIELLLARLEATGVADIRETVLWSLEGYTTKEIADKLDCTMATVQRKLRIIRRQCTASEEE